MKDRERQEKFTPGPWHILVPKPRYGNRECHSIVDGGGEYVAKTVAVSVLRGISAVKREERKANEHLIAAAPEMYKFGDEAVEIMRRIAGMFGVPYGLRDELEEQIEKWEEIKRKARGDK